MPSGPVPPLPSQRRLRSRSERHADRERLSLVRLRESLVGERPDGLEHAVPGPRGTVVGDDQGLAHQRVQQPQGLHVVARLGDGAQRRQVEAAGEHRRRPQHRALGFVQQVDGPRHRAAQGRLTIRSVLRPGQQPEPVAEPVPHLGRTHRGHPRRGQLDAQGQTVERLADLDHRRCGLLVEDPEAGPDGAGPLHEQRHRVGRHATVECQRRDRHHRLAGHQQPFPRRRHDPWRIGAGDDPPDGRDGRRQDVLAVVDHDEQAPPGHRLGDGVDDGGVALRGDAEGVGDGVGHGVGIADGCQLDQPHPVRELVGQVRCDGHGQPRLAHPADTAERHQLVRAGPAPRSRAARGRARSRSWPTSAGCLGVPPGSRRQSGNDGVSSLGPVRRGHEMDDLTLLTRRSTR